MIPQESHGHRLARKLYEILLPETKRSVATVEDWAVLGTLAGQVRSSNQDRMFTGYFAGTDGRIESKAFYVIALSDGMGGLSFGAEAASLTLSSFLWCLTSHNGGIAGRLFRAANYANQTVHEEFGGRAGATLSAVIVTDDGYSAAVNVGDSRIYGYDKSTRTLKQLTTDDTLAGLAGSGVSIDSRHNSGALLQHIGMGEELDPHIIESSYLWGMEYLILSTDGIHWIGNKLLELIVQNATDHVQCARRLLQLAEMAGANDNATLGIIKPVQLSALFPEPGGATADVEIWTPQGKTILLLEQVGPSRVVRDEPIPHGIAQKARERTPRKATTKRSPSKKTAKGSKRRVSADEEPELLIPRPELQVEFGSPKREEDETSR